MSGTNVKYRSTAGVKAKPEKKGARPTIAEEKAALNAALARKGNSVTPLRQRITREFRRSKHFGKFEQEETKGTEGSFEDEADGLEGLAL